MSEHERLLIGIAGPTCSGKTAIVKELKQRLGYSVSALSFDEYDLWSLGDEKLRNAARNGEFVNWESPEVYDYPRYLSQLQKLKKGHTIMLPRGSRESQNEGKGNILLTPAKYTIVEGTLIYWDDRAAQLFDKRFFIETPQDLMLSRRIKRSEGSNAPANQLEYMQTTMLEGMEHFVYPQMSKADVILDGIKPIEELTIEVLSSLS